MKPDKTADLPSAMQGILGMAAGAAFLPTGRSAGDSRGAAGRPGIPSGRSGGALRAGRPRRTRNHNGALGMVNGAAKLISSSVVGPLWTLASPVAAFVLAAALMAAGMIALVRGR